MTFDRMNELHRELITLECALVYYKLDSKEKILRGFLQRLELYYDTDNEIESDCVEFLQQNEEILQQFHDIKPDPFDLALEMAEWRDYDGVRYIGEWEGYAVYEPTFEDGKSQCIDAPQFILAKPDESHWAESEEEVRAVMRAIAASSDEN